MRIAAIILIIRIAAIKSKLLYFLSGHILINHMKITVQKQSNFMFT